MAQCSIADCGKEITSAITGSLCTSHYFALKKSQEAKNEPAKPSIEANPSHEDKPIILGKAKQEENAEDNPSHSPALQKVTVAPNDGKKYCQSCIERYGVLKLAMREWTPSYFICDDCLSPLLAQQLDYDTGRVEIVQRQLKAQPPSNSPLLNQVYDLMGIPPELRFTDANKLLQSRNDIFAFHAPAVVNKTIEQLAQQIEVYSILLFQIKIAIEPLQQYIDKVKYEERVKAGLSGLDKSEKEFTKRAKSGVKLSQDEKMAKTLNMTVEEYRGMASQARKTEFKKITGT